MRAAIMRQGTIVVDEMDDLEPFDGHVVVRTLACGICGSDLHALKHGHDMAKVQKAMSGSMGFDPNVDVVMGHEFCAEVIDAGSSTSVTEGQRVCSLPLAFKRSEERRVGKECRSRWSPYH